MTWGGHVGKRAVSEERTESLRERGRAWRALYRSERIAGWRRRESAPTESPERSPRTGVARVAHRYPGATVAHREQ